MCHIVAFNTFNTPVMDALTTHFCLTSYFAMCVKRNLSKGVDSNQSFLCLYYIGNCSVDQGLLSQRVVFSNKIFNFFKIYLSYRIYNFKISFY